ncbi:MAG: membrane protein [Saprospiraceae bacterium]|nr:MAG: membrane protein [Saprospiraceae bacterium]
MHRIAGWLVFAIALAVYFFTAERTGSLWDCGEFILGAYKLQVVHPPGAPLFVLIGRLFTWVATVVSDNPENIAFSVNLMSSICSAFVAMFICLVTIMFGKLALVGRSEDLDQGQAIATTGAGVVAGLAAAFCTSIWFSAVEGEVYAMSTFFTALTLWAMTKWYTLPDEPQSDRWLLLTVYSAGLSIGVHLLSILTFPALALLYYFKKYKTHTFGGIAISALVGLVFVAAIQKLIIVGIPSMWKAFEIFMVNDLGMPFHSGLIPTALIVGGVIIGGLYMAHKENMPVLQNVMVAAALLVISFSTIGVVVIRANAAPPVNMNAPTDAVRLLPYLNREQYGERPLLRGPNFDASPINTEVEDRYGRVGDHYEYTDYKFDVVYNNRDKMMFPRMSDGTQGRPNLYKQWMGLDARKALPAGRPNMVDNVKFLFNYQLGWMYWRYFMWNFSGRQNGDQGFYSWDKASGHWITGIKFLDAARLGNQSQLTDKALNDKARNVYYMLPFLFGLMGLFFHFKKRNKEALALMAMFIITGIGIIIYSNQPPNEPRERDYVLVGSFITYCIWIGMGVLAIFELLKNKLKQSGPIAAAVASVIVLIAPLLMGFQNFDDHDRSLIKGSRDYATNFLESCAPNAIVFTYGDNDTYPLWYAQEVENVRTDVRVVNLSLIAVDWYIDLLRRKVNDSPAINFTIPQEAYRGYKRNQVFYYNPNGAADRPKPLTEVLKNIALPRELPTRTGRTVEGFYSTTQAYIPVDRAAALRSGAITELDTNVVSNLPIKLSNTQIIKDELAVLDILASNLWERPIYFAVTSRREKLVNLEDFMQLEGLALRITAVQNSGDMENYGIVGAGRVNTDAVYNNVMNKFKWGNFDKYDLYVDRSYAPSVQSMQLAMRRTGFRLIRKNEKDKAIQLIDKYFEAFPDMNFTYDYRTWYMLGVYLQAGAYEKAKPHMEILARNLEDEMEFLSSLDKTTLENSNAFRADYYLSEDVMNGLIQEAERQNDNEFKTRLESMFSGYLTPSQGQQTPLD